MRLPILLAQLALVGLIGWSPAAAEDGKKVRAGWKQDWNARVDAHEKLLDHPCGDYAFDPWADAFLEGCEDGTTKPRSKKACKKRLDWVWERSRQCNTWQEWLLRNHRKHERSQAKEPPTRVD